MRLLCLSPLLVSCLFATAPAQDVVVDAVGPDNYSTPDMFGVTNNTGQQVAGITWDISNVPSAYWDLDGGANFGSSMTPVIGATGGMTSADVTWVFSGTHPTVLTARISPPMDPGDFFRFGVDTDYYKTDPCPGDNFGTAPPCPVTVDFASGLQSQCSFAVIGPNAAEARCSLPCSGYFQAYGSGCNGSSGMPVMAGGGCPTPGGAVRLDLSNIAPSAPAMLLTGTGNNSAVITPACQVQNLPFIPAFIVIPIPPGGSTSLPFTIPHATLVPLDLYLQVLILDVGVPGAIASTNPLQVHID